MSKSDIAYPPNNKHFDDAQVGFFDEQLRQCGQYQMENVE
jgi:hypothetical protein